MWQIDGRVVDQTADLLLLELVGAEDLEAAGAIVGGEPVRRGLEDGEHLLDRDALLQTHTAGLAHIRRDGVREEERRRRRSWGLTRSTFSFLRSSSDAMVARRGSLTLAGLAGAAPS